MIFIANTAEETLQLVLAGDAGVEAVFAEHCPGRMNEVMAPQAKRLLDGRMDELTAVACVRGPGSFTGVRMGLAFVTGLALARGIPMAGLDYLPLLAASAAGPGGAASHAPPHACDIGQIHVITHSRTARVYHQAFGSWSSGDSILNSGIAGNALPDQAPLPPGSRLDAPSLRGGPGPSLLLRPLTSPRDLTVSEARALIKAAASEAPAAVLGSGLRRNPGAFADIPGATLLSWENPTPEALAAAAIRAAFDGPPVDALYLRGSDAEENLAMIAKGRGLSEEEARQRMEKALQAPPAI